MKRARTDPVLILVMNSAELDCVIRVTEYPEVARDCLFNQKYALTTAHIDKDTRLDGVCAKGAVCDGKCPYPSLQSLIYGMLNDKGWSYQVGDRHTFTAGLHHTVLWLLDDSRYNDWKDVASTNALICPPWE